MCPDQVYFPSKVVSLNDYKVPEVSIKNDFFKKHKNNKKLTFLFCVQEVCFFDHPLLVFSSNFFEWKYDQHHTVVWNVNV